MTVNDEEKKWLNNLFNFIKKLFNFIKEYKSSLYFSLFFGMLIPFSYLHYIEASYTIIDYFHAIYSTFAITLIFVIYLLVFMYLPLFLLQEYAKSIRVEIESFGNIYNESTKRHWIIRKARTLNRSVLYSFGGWIFIIILLVFLPEDFINSADRDYGIILIIMPLLFTPVYFLLQVYSRHPWLTVLFGFSSLIGFIFTNKENSWGFTLGVILGTASIISFVYEPSVLGKNFKLQRWKYDNRRKAHSVRPTLGNKSLLTMLSKYKITKKADGRILNRRKKGTFFLSAKLLLFINFLLLLFFIFFLIDGLPSQISTEPSNGFLTSISPYLYRMLILISFCAAVFNNENFFDFSKPVEELSKVIISMNMVLFGLIFFVFMLSYIWIQSYPTFMFNSMRAIGLVEWPREANLYVIDERYIQRNKLENRFLVYRQKFVLPEFNGDKMKEDNIQNNSESREYLESKKLFKEKKQAFTDNEHVLYGYIAWNSTEVKIFCPTNEAIQKNLSSKCLKIPSEYINSFL
ncbi:hypothetical protein [Neisseria animalis]|uniref:Uncharacterized protein n=1 Tax=Neisseria animalis TaxID=492 RepID=A0A5P3MVW7_NEIAN|nr:hypothetical protein [Neisseria animalis]QEY24799.1 hypothetical protein D0T90_10235 [Neisseria animalis]ROW31531.1 hypothetical protein CGZ60_09765 [Neisseria animalis]VEE07689.1 Uncharacterised protein [Neisseria animalis]